VVSKKYINRNIESRYIGIIYFLPAKFRLVNLPPIPTILKNSKYWHTGITYNNKCYECFNFGRYNISLMRIRYREFPNGQFTAINHPIDINKLKSEITSGTSCSEYVARVVGLSNKTGPDKGLYLPDDLYRILNDKTKRLKNE